MNVSRTEDDDDDEWYGGHGHCMPLPLRLMMNSPLMQMMQHDRVSLLNNPSRKINQHGRGQSTFIRQTKEKIWQRQRDVTSEKEWSIFCWRKLYYLQLTDVSLIEQVIWRRDIIIYVLNYSLPPYYSSSSFPRTKVYVIVFMQCRDLRIHSTYYIDHHNDFNYVII